ncbi:LytR/AlgR family response regulator transcription factor [Desulfurella sp.]|uniref:LytR/AlgR family response regulator transcription factor n=1 Tax=Desulfurella sp. TaxID=1962857 RepID=UPI003D138824
MLKALIVEDEQPAIDELSYLLGLFNDIEIVGYAQNGIEGLKLAKNLKPNVVLIDINIPKINGLELLKMLENQNIAIIFTTAYDNYAVEAFELNAIDYLLKPISASRLQKALEKAKNFVKKNELQNKKINKIPVEKKGKIYLLDFSEIVFARSQEGFVEISTKDSTFLFKNSMKNLEEKLQNFSQFYRVQKSYIVNLEYILEIIPWFKSTYWLVVKDANKTRIPVSKSNIKELKSILGLF